MFNLGMFTEPIVFEKGTKVEKLEKIILRQVETIEDLEGNKEWLQDMNSTYHKKLLALKNKNFLLKKELEGRKESDKNRAAELRTLRKENTHMVKKLEKLERIIEGLTELKKGE